MRYMWIGKTFACLLIVALLHRTFLSIFHYHTYTILYNEYRHVMSILVYSDYGRAPDLKVYYVAKYLPINMLTQNSIETFSFNRRLRKIGLD